MATFTINVSAYVNVAPTIGNISQTINNRTILTFTQAMFTTLPTPAFADTEGETAPTNIKIVTLPSIGVLKFNGTVIIENQIIPYVNASSITYESPNQDAVATASFTFQVSDSLGAYSS